MKPNYKIAFFLSLPSLFLFLAKFDLQAYLFIQIISFSIIGCLKTNFIKTTIPFLLLLVLYCSTIVIIQSKPILFLIITTTLSLIVGIIILFLYRFALKTQWYKQLWTLSATSFLFSVLSIFIAFHVLQSEYTSQIKFITIAITYVISGTLLAKYSPNYSRDYWWLTMPMLIFIGGSSIPFGSYGAIPSIFLTFFATYIGKVFYQSFSDKSLKSSISILAFYTLAILCLALYGVSNYEVWLAQKEYDKNGSIKGFTFRNIKNSETLDLNKIKGKIIVLDFWTTNCGICFKKFKDLEEVHKKYKNNPNIEVLAVNLPLDSRGKVESDSLFFNRVKTHVYNKGYTFPVFKADSSFTYYKEAFDINGVPQIIVLNQQSKVQYKGLLHTDKFIKVDNIYNIIENLIQ